jgi:cell wall-associated NlpC family hydrolase
MPAQSAKKAVWAVLLTLLTACASAPPGGKRGSAVDVHGLGEDDQAVASANPAAANDVLFQAISLVGTPYRYGGNSPETGFDCSGLIGYVFLHSAGLKLPRSTAELIDLNAPQVEQSRLIPGDLVYFNTLGGRVSHIGIYVGERRFVHAPSSGGFVRMDNLDTPYWQKHYVEAKRILSGD